VLGASPLGSGEGVALGECWRSGLCGVFRALLLGSVGGVAFGECSRALLLKSAWGRVLLLGGVGCFLMHVGTLRLGTVCWCLDGTGVCVCVVGGPIYRWLDVCRYMACFLWAALHGVGLGCVVTGVLYRGLCPDALNDPVSPGKSR